MSTPFQTPTDAANEFTKLQFVFLQLLRGLAGPTLVKVVACSTNGALAPTGTVDVQPLVNQVDGAGTGVAHDVVYGVPYVRFQGQDSAVILDPQPGDIGVAVFASRDISAVVAAKGPANPGSRRVYDFADGLYLGAVLGATPTQYVRFYAGGVDVVSPGTVTIRGASIVLDGPVTGTHGAEFTQDVTAQGTSVHNHTHPDPQGGNTGPPNP